MGLTCLNFLYVGRPIPLAGCHILWCTEMSILFFFFPQMVWLSVKVLLYLKVVLDFRQECFMVL